ncbi:MAG TPA: DUF998 domain-containing protein [Mycobacterium sp.]|nr:DUF998 domain-containing protein [Mycobacterium sp.]
MSSATSSESWVKFRSGWWHSRMTKRLLLIAGIVGVGVYAVGDVVSGLLYHGYSFRDQVISELSAFGSPVRPLMVTVIVVHALLVTALGIGIWRSADEKSLRLAGVFMVGAGLVGFPNHTVFAMSSRWMEGGFNDIMHMVLSNVFSLFVFMAMVLSAVAYRGWFRLYTIATLLVIIGFGGAAWSAIQGIGENRTPWAGGFERINAYAYFAWIIVLALTMIRRSLSQSETDAVAAAPEREARRVARIGG